MNVNKPTGQIKRLRGIIFTTGETIILVDLVLKYKHILENKKTDGVSSKEKEKMWSILADEFNATSGCSPRSWLTLKTKFENLKRICRKMLCEERMETFKTGGGTAEVPKWDPVLEKVRSILSVSGCGLVNPYDSNASFPDQNQSDGKNSFYYLQMSLLLRARST